MELILQKCIWWRKVSVRNKAKAMEDRSQTTVRPVASLPTCLFNKRPTHFVDTNVPSMADSVAVESI